MSNDHDGRVHMNFGKDDEPAPVAKAPAAPAKGKDGKPATAPLQPATPAPTTPAKADADVTTYSSFEACYMAKIHGKPALSRDEQYKEAEKEYAGKESIDSLRAYEKKFDCSGICDVPLFYLSRELADGPPPEDCVDAILKSFTDSYAVAAISLTLFLMFLFGAIATVPNCCGGSSSGGQKPTKGKHHALAEDPNTTQ